MEKTTTTTTATQEDIDFLSDVLTVSYDGDVYTISYQYPERDDDETPEEYDQVLDIFDIELDRSLTAVAPVLVGVTTTSDTGCSWTVKATPEAVVALKGLGL